MIWCQDEHRETHVKDSTVARAGGNEMIATYKTPDWYTNTLRHMRENSMTFKRGDMDIALERIGQLERELAEARAKLVASTECIKALRTICMDTTEDLRSVLCDPEDICCIDGSDADRSIVNQSITKLHDVVVSIDKRLFT